MLINDLVRNRGRLRVAVRVSRLSRTSFDMQYEVLGEEDGELLVSGTTVQVMYDYEAGRSRRMPDELRTTLEAYDGPFS